MPPLAGIGVAIGTAAASAGAAVGAGLAAAGSAIGGMTLSGLATGLTIASTGMQVIGMATGNKTLSKIGMYGGMVGGAGMLAGIATAGKTVSKLSQGGKLLDSTKVDSMLDSPKAKAAGFSTMKTTPQASAADAFSTASSNLGYKPEGVNKLATFDPVEEQSFWDKTNGVLTQYNPMMNILGGMGEAYMLNEQMDQRMQMHKDNFGLQKQQFDRLNANNSTVVNANPSVGLQRDPYAYSGILRS